MTRGMMEKYDKSSNRNKCTHITINEGLWNETPIIYIYIKLIFGALFILKTFDRSDQTL